MSVAKTTIEQENTYDEITVPLDCPIYRANLASATIADCGLCACTHCIQQCLESDRPCSMCSRCLRLHTFIEHASNSPEVIDGLLTLKDKEIERRELIIQEQFNTIEELQSQMEISGNQLQVYAQFCAEQDAQLKHLLGNTIPELQGRVAELEDQLEISGNYINVLENGANQLQSYVQLCKDQDAQLKHIWRNILPELQGHLEELEDQLEESGNDIGLLDDEERTGDDITAPFDCPIYRANLERATIADCGLCACTHCIQQCSESDKTCSLCNRCIGVHTFTDHATDSPEVIDALFRIKDKEIERRELIIQERDKAVEELPILHRQLMTAIVRLEEEAEKVEIYVRHGQKKDTELQNLHENIIPEKDKSIEDQKNEIIYLKRKEKDFAERLRRLQEEIQDVKEKNIELNRKEELTECVESLQEGIRTVKEKNKEMNRKEMELTKHVESLQEEIQGVKEKNIELNNTFTKTEEEVVRIEEELEVYVLLCSEKDTELQDLHENIIPEKDTVIEDQKISIINLMGQMEISGNQLQVYAQFCAEQDAQLKHLLGNTIPELQGRVAELEDMVATFRRETVTIAKFKALPGTSLCTAIQQLQHYYDREYRCRYEITDKLDALLQTRLEDVLTELLNETSEIGDQLALVIRTYVSLVEENSNLHRSIKTQEHTINDMKTELRQTKASKLRMEQRNMLRAEE